MIFNVINNGDFKNGVSPFNIKVKVEGVECLGDAFVQDFVPKFKSQLRSQFRTKNVLTDEELDNSLMESEYGLPLDINLQEDGYDF